MHSFQSQFVPILVIGIIFISGAFAGFEGIFCSSTPGGKTLSRCDRDCQTAHNAETGKCGHNHNCYCSFPLTSVNNRSVQCLNETVTKWDEVCNFDCQCLHGSLGGICDYRTHGCTCIGNNNVFEKKLCPFANATELLVYFKQSYDSLGMPDFANLILSGATGNKHQTIELK